jgi:hypothetical protein
MRQDAVHNPVHMRFFHALRVVLETHNPTPLIEAFDMGNDALPPQKCLYDNSSGVSITCNGSDEETR